MGSREKNFYNQLVTRYGYGDAARGDPGPLPRRASRRRRWPKIPDDLIDKVALTGPKEAVKERLDAYRDAGVGTLLVTPAAATQEDRLRMMRDLAEIAA